MRYPVTIFLFAFAAACSSPPGPEPETTPVGSDDTNGDEATVESGPPVDVACETLSTDPGFGCADAPELRGRAGGLCPSGEAMTEIPGVYAFPEAPVEASSMPTGVHKTTSGLGTCVVRAGTGDTHPSRTEEVTVHYLGWNAADGVFDSSVSRQEPATFPLDRVIGGWTEGVQLMVPGEVRRFFIPEYLAYQGQPGRPGGMLLFDVELLQIGAGD